MKWAALVSRSTTTHMESCPFWVLGSPTTKSIPISSHFQTGMGRGCNNPAGFWCSALILWQVSQCATNRAISAFIPFHQYFCFKSIYILVDPEGMEYAELWASSMIICLKSPFWGTQILSLYHNVPLLSTRKSGALFSPVCLRISISPLSDLWAFLILSSRVD